MKGIIRKELTDYFFSSARVLVLFLLVVLVSASTLYTDYQGIRGTGSQGFVFLGLFTTSGDVLPSLAGLLALFIVPLMGIALGFDAINSERSGGTISRILSQPIYRDAVINGKTLASLITLTIMVTTTLLVVSGYGLKMIGVPPSAEEIIRLFMYLLLTVIYGAFWIGMAMLFSILFRRVAASLLTAIAAWLFFSIFISMIASAVASSAAPTTGGTIAEALKNVQLQQAIMRFSPNNLFAEAAVLLLHPVLLETITGMVGAVASGQAQFMLPNPLSLGQSLLIIWPNVVTLVSLSVFCFGLSYVIFMRQEIRAT